MPHPFLGGPWQRTLREVKAGNASTSGGWKEPAFRKYGASIPRQPPSPLITGEFLVNQSITATVQEIALMTPGRAFEGLKTKSTPQYAK